MKTAFSLSDALFERAERLRRELGWSRSKFYSDALEVFVALRERSAVTAKLDEVYCDGEEIDRVLARAARKVVERTPW
jgi:hypothetical protein